MKPQYIEIDKNGNKYHYSNKKMTRCHRVDGPAVEYKDGLCIWYFNGKIHREDGPAITWNGSYEWWTNGKLHKEDGPAIDPVNGNKEWYLHGIKLTEREHNMFIQLDQ